MSFYNNRYARTGGYSNTARRNLAAPMPTNRPAVTCNFSAPKWVAFKAVQPVRAQWVETKAGSPNFDFPEKMYGAVIRFGDLTQGQGEAIDRMIARDADRAVQAPRATVGVDASKIADAFQRAREAGLSRVGLFFNGLVFKPAKKDPAIIYVTQSKEYGAVYYGKIVNGQFSAGRDCTPEVQARIVLVAADPMAAAQAHGYETANCVICSRLLENKESVETGIGPICAGRMGWTPGRLRRDNGVDF